MNPTGTTTAGRPQVWPLTQAQRGLWFLDAFNPGSPFYVIATGVRLRGPLDTDALRAALSDTVARQPALRTRFVSLNGWPYQVFTPPRPFGLPLTDLSALPADEAERAALGRCDELAVQPFDLARDDLLRAELLRLAEDDHVLVFAVHHILFDAWSTQVMLTDLATAYAARQAGRAPDFPPLATSVGDHAMEQEARYARDSEATRQAMEYWRQQLAGATRVELPADHARPERRRFTGATLVHDLTAETTERIRQLASAAGVTPFHVLLTGFNLTLARITGQTDITVGVPLAGRTRADTDALIGFFVNNLPLRVDLDGAASFREALDRHWTPVLDLFSQQEFPFARLVDELRADRSVNRNPLFDVVFQILPAPGAGLRIGQAEVEVFGGRRPAAQFDLSCDVHDLGDRMRIVFEYSDELFSAETMTAYQRMMAAILEDAVAGPGGQRGAGDGPAGEHATGPTPEEAPAAWAEGGLAGLVAAHAAARPDTPALRCGEAELTFAALDAAVTALASRLLAAGVTAGDPVALLVEPSAGTAVGMLAALRCGAVYVPMDPRTPPARIGVLLDQVGCRTVIVDSVTAGHPAVAGRRTVPLAGGEPEGSVPPEPLVRASAAIGPHTPAYVIFTSGSTGRPKAVSVGHGSALHLARGAAGVYELTARDRVLQMASAAVDVSIEEFFGAWWAGGCVVMHLAAAGEDLDLLIRRRELTVLNLPASRWHEWTRHLAAVREPVPRSVRLVVAGSERVDPSTVRTWQDGPGRGVRLLNAYGTTEATVTSVVYDTAELPGDAAHTAQVPIGHAMPGVRLYVLDERLAPVPDGVPGELAIGGPGVALGYLGDPVSTAERFLDDPFSDVPGARLYRTGDRVRRLPSGALDFLGRTDTQVKIRGTRVDLAEVERSAMELPGVSEFVADVRDLGESGGRLVGYLVPTRPGDDRELAGDRVEEWRRIHDDDAFNEIAESDDTLVNASGWTSSYTLERISPQEMGEWLDATTECVLSAPPGRVWEIGCGTGMVLFRVAPHARTYLGTDIAPSALKYVEGRLEEAGLGDGRVRLAVSEAHDATVAGDEEFDLVILNSVVQYFPDARYLETVLELAWRRLRPGGRIFVGDVRDLTTLPGFHLSIARHRGCDDQDPATLADIVREAAEAESELCLAPAYFTALAERLDPERPPLVRLHAKRGREDTEMNRFRYDVVLTRDHDAAPAAPAPAAPAVHDGPVDPAGLDAVLAAAATRPAVLTGVPDARSYPDTALADALDHTRLPRFADLAAAVQGALPPMFHPDDIRDRAARLGASVHIAPAGDGLLDVLVGATPAELDALVRAGTLTRSGRPGQSGRPDANQPLRAVHHRRVLAAVRAHLQAHLPPAMVPGRMMVIEQVPTTISGKVDRGRLPDPPRTATTTHVAPRTPVERALAEIWAQTLGLDACGVRDNFFEIGGDSITWLQVMSRSARAGHRFATSDIFDHPTIERLAAHWATADRAGTDEPAEIPSQAGLTPIQHWFFEAFAEGRGRQNQSAWFSLDPGVDAGELGLALLAVMKDHQALTLTFRQTSDGWRQYRGDPPAEPPLTVVDLSVLGPVEREAALRAAADHAQDSLDVQHGPLLRMCLFRTPPGDRDLLFWCVHHLAVDAVSWQFLAEDLAAALDGTRGTAPEVRPAPGTDVLTWAQWSARAASRMSGDELDHWRRAAAAPGFALPLTDPLASARATDAHARSGPVAARGLTERPGDEVLARCLQALARVLPEWTGRPAGTVWLEYHGRPMSAEEPDVARTVGWFTALFPFLIGPDQDADGVRARLRAVPRHGIGYGRARYLDGRPLAGEANIVVNYLGPAARPTGDGVLRAEPGLTPLSGPAFGGDSDLPFAAEINWYLDQDGTLTVEAALGARYFTADAADRFIERLRAAAAEEFAGGATPAGEGGSRFALLPDSAHQSPAMAELTAAPDLADGYQLTPIQRSMLYRHLIDPSGDLNYNTAVYQLRGALDPAVLGEAWEVLTARHTVLRTSLRWTGFDDPFQLVHHSGPPAPRLLDWSGLDDTTADARLRELLDAERATPPPLSGTPPFRLTLIRLAADRHRLVWCDHHILLDGWSSGILVDELLRAYGDLAAARGPLADAPSPVPYRDYVAWLRQQGTEAASRYWSTALGGFARPTPVPFAAPTPAAVGTADEFDESERQLAPDLAAGLRRLAHQEGTTVGNVLGAAWAAILHRYGGDDRVVFGVAQNGRPAGLGDVTAMVGLYAHTMPLSVAVRGSDTVGQLLGNVTRESWRLADFAGTGSLWDVYDWAGIPVGRPLFDSVVVVQNFTRPDTEGDDRPVRATIEHAQTVTGFPVTLVADPASATLRLVRRTDLLDRAAAEGLLDALETVLRQFVLRPDQPLTELGVELPAHDGEAAAAGPARRPGHELDPPRGETEQRIAALWCTVLGLPAVGRSVNLFDLGANSLSARRLHVALDAEFAVRIQVVDVFAFPTVAAMAARIDAGASGHDTDTDVASARAERVALRRAALHAPQTGARERARSRRRSE